MSGETTVENRHLYTFGPFRLDAAERRLLRDGEILPLPRKAFNLLLLLVADAGRLQTRETLIEALWPRSIVEEQGLSARIHALRRVLGDEGDTPRYIETVRGVGYRFIAPVEVESLAPEETASPPTGNVSSRRWLKPIAGAAAVVILVTAGLIAWYFVTRPPGAETNSTGTNSIAVLPFENLSADPTNAYFAAGIQDEILTRLASIGSLKVIARTSSEHYPSHPDNLRDVARQLGVTTVLEGSVQRAGDEVHINVQLIDARTLAHIWARSYNRTLTNVFRVEGDVAQEIAESLRARLLPRKRSQLARAPTRDPHAYNLFLEADYYANRIFSRGNVKDPAAAVHQAVALYRRATARDPRFALAWARLSLLESRASWYGIDAGASRIAAAEQMAKRALALDPTLPQAHMAMGYIEYYCRKNYPAALAEFERARENLPNDANVIAAIAFIHRRQGKWQQALAELRQAASLDPRNPQRHYEIGVTLAELRRYADAERQFNEALAIEPYDYVATVYKIRLLFLTGKTTRARQELATGPTGIDPQGSFSTLRFESAWLARKPEQALAALASAPAWALSAFTEYEVPTSLLRGRAWALKEAGDQARRAYEDARTKLHTALNQKPDDPTLWGALGMAEAGLGEKQKAIRTGTRATQLLPVSKDAFYGTAHLAVLAKIYAQTGETDRAVKLLARLLAMPAGGTVSVPLLRLDPAWDPLRKDPRFQALLKKK